MGTTKYKTKYKAYFIECITNLHVGSGDTNYGLVDNLVQRDPVTNHPTINSTSLKGGLREHFEGKWGKDNDKITNIFGQDNNPESNKQPKTGNYNFLGADLIALPIRSNYQQYFLTFDDKIVENVNQKAKLLIGSEIFETGLETDKLYLKSEPNYDVFLEDKKVDIFKKESSNYKIPLNSNINLPENFSKQFAYLKHNNAKPFYKDLPTVARNKVGNGDSDNNLWYEELVPHKSTFITYISCDEENKVNGFEDALAKDVIQIGANSSVGYGLCKFHKVLKEESNENNK